MRILLDENMPLDFGPRLVGHEAKHVEDLGLKGVRNGALMTYARANFDAFVTLDRGILYQHRHDGHDLIVITLRVPNSRPSTVNSRASELADRLKLCQPGDRFEM